METPKRSKIYPHCKWRKEGENMNYADIKRVDVANGEGVRVSVFVSRM